MKVIVPGGHYSYDSATKKLYPSYEYYNVGVEQVESIRNLSKDMLFYDASNPQYPITVENGCITHTYPSAGTDTDKIQIVLRTPFSLPDSGFFNYGFFGNYLYDMNFFAGGI
jgi:hypothetical protein